MAVPVRGARTSVAHARDMWRKKICFIYATLLCRFRKENAPEQRVEAGAFFMPMLLSFIYDSTVAFAATRRYENLRTFAQY